MDLAFEHYTAGRLAEAESIYQQILQADPGHPVAMHFLGVIAHQMGDNETGVDLLRKALAIKPDFDEAHFNLGIMLKELNKPDEAIQSYHQAIAINPGYAEAYNNLGTVLQKQFKLDEAETSYRKAIAINSDYAEAHNNLGNALKELNHLDKAESSYRTAIAIRPDYAKAHNNLGNTQKELGNLEDAIACFHKALDIWPDYAEAHNNLGNTLKELGELDDAVASFRKALAIRPDFIQAHDNILLTEQYRIGNTSKTLFQLHRQWDAQHGKKFQPSWPKHSNTGEPARRIRIGFVSPDLGRHPVGYFVVRLLENLPEKEIETVVYSELVDDDLTQRIKTAANVWHNVSGIPDDKLATMIINDGIDIVIDLAGHSANNRLLVFARKPAPLQVSWAGYVGTTGLSAIDYLISDRYSTPVDEEPFYQEKIIRMPDGWLCYDPPDYAPAVGEAPFKQNGRVTFGSFSNPAKINEEVVHVWAIILTAVANSQLLIKYKGINSRANAERLSALFEEEGLDASRLILEGPSSHVDLLARYNDIDIALDPFPYSGGLTTYEALWMGVPVITVPGRTFASRHSFSHLSTLGLHELSARDQDEYVSLAVGLANDGGKLVRLRAELREMMASSPICNGEKFAIGFATRMREIWRYWCLSKN